MLYLNPRAQRCWRALNVPSQGEWTSPWHCLWNWSVAILAYQYIGLCIKWLSSFMAWSGYSHPLCDTCRALLMYPAMEVADYSMPGGFEHLWEWSTKPTSNEFSSHLALLIWISNWLSKRLVLIPAHRAQLSCCSSYATREHLTFSHQLCTASLYIMPCLATEARVA